MKRRIRLSESDLHRIVKESVRRILKEDNGGRYQVCIFPLSNGGMTARAVEVGNPAIEDALHAGYVGTLEDCEARAEKWNDKNYWNKQNFYPNYTD